MDVVGMSLEADVEAGGSEPEVAWVRTEREGETGGFPLIIYSISLESRHQALPRSPASSVPFEASGCLSTWLGGAAFAPRRHLMVLKDPAAPSHVCSFQGVTAPRSLAPLYLVALASFKGHGQPSAIVPCPVLPWQVKQRMWKWLFCTRTTSPLQVSPQR